MERRELIRIAGALSLLGVGEAATAQTAPTPDNGARVKIIHIHATPDGESHLDDMVVQPNAKPIPLASMSVSAYHPTNVQWHNVPTPQFAINMTGTLEVEVSTGTKRLIGPGDLVFLEDATGKGHITRLQTPVSNLFIRVAQGFDIIAWAAGR